VTEVLLYALGIVIMLLGFVISIGLHEVGHLIPAKLFGVKVTQYMIGFGKTIWSKRRGETEYGFKMLPLGGYIAMTGMTPPEEPGEAARVSTTGFLNTVMQEGSAERGHTTLTEEERGPDPLAASDDDDARSFYRLAMWKKIVVMLGGPAMNLVLAFVFFTIVLVGFGIPQNSTTISSVNECLIPATSTRSSCDAGDAEAPGAKAGLRPGDRIVAIDGAPVTDWEQLRELVAASPGAALTFTIERDGTEQSLRITPAENQRTAVDSDGQTLTGSDGKPVIETVGMIGVLPASETVRQPLHDVPTFVGDNIARVAGVIIHLPQRLVDVWNAAFSSEQRDPDGPVSVVGVGRMAGEIVSLDEAPVAARAQSMFALLGSLNVALLVFNLVPLMPLDGGHVAGALYEGAKRGIARLRGRPDPGPVDATRMMPVTFTVVVLLGAMSLLLMYADIVKPISLFG